MKNNTMKKLKYLFSLLAIAFFNVMMFAADDWEGDDDCPSCPPNPGNHDGAMRNVPIDMYVVLLGIVAIMMIVYFVRLQQNKNRLA